jgi:hypothetical protein
MKINLLKLNLAALIFLAGMWNMKAIANKYIVKSALNSTQNIDTSKIVRTVNSMPVQTTDTGNYGLHMQISKDKQDYAQTGIYFYANASDKFVQNEDAIVVNGGMPLVYIWSYTSDNVAVCINTLSDYARGKRVRLFVTAVYNGDYSLSLADIFNIDTASYNVYLVDNEKKDSVDILHTNSYPFTINNGDTASFGAYRFVLSIQHKPIGPYSLSAFSGKKISTGVQLNWQAINAGNFTGFTLQKLNSGNSFDSLYCVQSDPGTTYYSFTDLHPVIGNNVYRLQQSGVNGSITYSSNISIGYNTASPNGSMNIYPNPASSTMTVSILSGSATVVTYVADIYDMAGNHVNHQVANTGQWTNDVSAFKNGLYIITIKDANGNLVGQSKFMKAN